MQVVDSGPHMSKRETTPALRDGQFSTRLPLEETGGDRCRTAEPQAFQLLRDDPEITDSDGATGRLQGRRSRVVLQAVLAEQLAQHHRPRHRVRINPIGFDLATQCDEVGAQRPGRAASASEVTGRTTRDLTCLVELARDHEQAGEHELGLSLPVP
ncbi:MAG: hypothetical protein ACRDPQ_02970 [Nocardioidaceae bacterium]